MSERSEDPRDEKGEQARFDVEQLSRSSRQHLSAHPPYLLRPERAAQHESQKDEKPGDTRFRGNMEVRAARVFSPSHSRAEASQLRTPSVPEPVAAPPAPR